MFSIAFLRSDFFVLVSSVNVNLKDQCLSSALLMSELVPVDSWAAEENLENRQRLKRLECPPPVVGPIILLLLMFSTF